MRKRLLLAGAVSCLLTAGALPASSAGAAEEGCSPTSENRPVCPSGGSAATATFLDPTARITAPHRVRLAEQVYVGPFAELLASDDAPISVGPESNVQDNVLVLGSRAGTEHAEDGDGHADEGVEIAGRVILAHGASVIGPAQIGVEGEDVEADPDDDQEVFLSFASQVDGAVLEKNTGVSALARVGPGVRLRSGTLVLPGKNITTQEQADNPRLGKVRKVNEADVAFNEAVIDVNVAFAREYTQMYREDPSSVRGVNLDPGGTEFNADRDAPRFDGEERRIPSYGNRIIGDVRFDDTFGRFSSVTGTRVALRADEGEPFRVGHVDHMDSNVIFHALEEADLRVGDRVSYGNRAIVHGGGRVVQEGDPEEPTVLEDDVVLHDSAIVFRSTVGEGSVIGERSAVVGSELEAGTEIPARTIWLNGEKFGDVEWEDRSLSAGGPVGGVDAGAGGARPSTARVVLPVGLGSLLLLAAAGVLRRAARSR